MWIVTNSLRLGAAQDAIEAVGRGEYQTRIAFGHFLSACPFDPVTVEFWANWVNQGERQGYVCGGVLFPARLHIVPFDNGSNGAFDHG
ncbi:hypothetical protein [Sphingobium sp. WCS2017Hpa-17]|uniref:hypothetical protein n=1 Tax=Sphingobium sp. WCS2017Hpa-17 TaxID=3073638 RepID=UPI002889D4DC|nr:hypothetical protein [Sphingobium sp. WCS2017Hpa-17]